MLSGSAFQKVGRDPFRTAEKNPHSQVVQEAEFALVGIGIALLHSHEQKAAFALNRSGDFAVAGRETRFTRTPLSAVSSGLVFLA